MLLCATLGLATSRAQDAVLVLTPGPVLTTTAGTGTHGFAGDGGLANLARLAGPSGMAYDAAGNLFFADTRNHRIRRVSPDGEIATVAGTGVQGFDGDGGPATTAQLDSPLGVAVGQDGALYIADSRNQRIRRVATDGTITTVAGTGTAGFSGDIGPATAASLRNPSAVAIGLHGELYLADSGNHRIRRVALDGTIQTVAGSGREEATGDGGSALLAGLDAPSGVAVRPTDGALLIADRLNSRVRVVNTAGTITSLDTGSVSLRRESGVGVDASGTIFIADRDNYRLRAVTANGSGTLLGSGEQGTPDPAASYRATPLGAPYAVVADNAGGVAFADRDHAQVLHLALPQLTFATTVVGQLSPARTVALSNTGAEPVTILAISTGATFPVGVAGSCGSVPFAVAAAASCTVSLAFAPVAAGPASGTLSVTTGGLPQQVLLQGTGVVAGTLLQTSTVIRSSWNLSYVGMPVKLQVQVLASGTLVPSGNVHLLDASAELARAALDGTGSASFTTSSLTIGQHSLAVHYDGDARNAPSSSAAQTQTVVPAPDFTLTAAATSLRIAAGTSAQMAVVLQPTNGTLNKQVAITVEGLPAGTTVTTDAPTPLMLASNAVTVTLSVKTPATMAGLGRSTGLSSFALLIVPLLARRRSRQSAVSVAVGGMLLFATGCGGGYLGGARTASSAAHSYPVTVTAMSTGVTGSALVHTTAFTLVVQ